MKANFAALLLAPAILALIGCESDLPPSHTEPNSAQKLQRGIVGQGTLTQPGQSEDAALRQQSRGDY